MKKGKILLYLFIGLLTSSCSVETLNYSSKLDKGQDPNSVLGGSHFVEDKITSTEISVEKVKYVSDLTNIITVFPKFKNSAINNEIKSLKASLQSFIYATTGKKPKEKREAYRDYVKSFKTLQNLKKYMNPDEVELLDRYLARIKSNMNSLEYLS